MKGPGLLQHYTIRCDNCGYVKDWVFLMGSGWRTCVDCYEKEYGPQPEARAQMEELELFKMKHPGERESHIFWSGING